MEDKTALRQIGIWPLILMLLKQLMVLFQILVFFLSLLVCLLLYSLTIQSLSGSLPINLMYFNFPKGHRLGCFAGGGGIFYIFRNFKKYCGLSSDSEPPFQKLFLFCYCHKYFCFSISVLNPVSYYF